MAVAEALLPEAVVVVVVAEAVVADFAQCVLWNRSEGGGETGASVCGSTADYRAATGTEGHRRTAAIGRSAGESSRCCTDATAQCFRTGILRISGV